MSGPRAPRRSLRDPYGLLPSGSPVAPALAVVGLVIVAFLTVGLMQGQLPIVSGGGGGGGGGVQTPVPSGIVVDPRADVPGTIVYAKGGAIFAQSGKDVRQLTSGHQDSMPAWSADGTSVYFIRTASAYTKWLLNGAVTQYVLTYPLLMRVTATGGAPQQLASGLFSKGSYSWFFWIRQPAPDPADANRVAVVSDGPDPIRSDTVLQLFDVATGKFSVVKGLTETPPLGHQDPTWQPDGKLLLYTKNGRDGSRGAPEIWAWDPGTGKARQVTSAGYLQPSWSPDGRYFAATKTSQYGTDVVVIDPTTGAEVLRVTADGESFAPAWSPRGDAIAYLHTKGGIIDLRMASLEGSGSTTKVTETIDLTTVSGLDGQSRPSWYIPASELPPSPSPSAAQSQAAPSTAGPSPSASH
jgi:WD40-like Beta Propeller Repeat